MAKPVIPYLKGFEVKPLSVSGLGTVLFTSGDLEGEPIEVIPNQLQCESYGYTYNRVTGTCSVFRYSTNLNKSFENEVVPVIIEYFLLLENNSSILLETGDKIIL